MKKEALKKDSVKAAEGFRSAPEKSASKASREKSARGGKSTGKASPKVSREKSARGGKKKAGRHILTALLLIIFIPLFLLLSVNAFVKFSVKGGIISAEEAAENGDYDCILVLGCGVREDGTPSPLLTHRLDTAAALYEAGAAPKLLLSGDHGSLYYNEVRAMKNYLMEKGVPEEDIFMDHAGFCTYDSIYRAQYIFSAERILVVTQEYHLYRALYIGRAFGMEADGVDAGMLPYSYQIYRDAREAVARCKDFIWCIFKPDPEYLGEKIPLSGDGRLTED